MLHTNYGANPNIKGPWKTRLAGTIKGHRFALKIINDCVKWVKLGFNNALIGRFDLEE